MHGDEPTSTAALLDILNYMGSNPEDPYVKAILSGATLLIIPMLNPDGAERYTRRNAQGIDINRDARNLQTPEAKILKAARDEYLPEFGFNLHDQSTRRMVGNTKNIVAISLLVPPPDAENTQNKTTLRARKVAATFHEAISPYCEGMISKYDADYMPRAFGDSMQSWGVSTILIEGGGWTGNDRSMLTQIHFAGMMSMFYAIATDSYKNADPTIYDRLDRSGEHDLFDLLIKNVTIVGGKDQPPFRADVGINYRLDRRSPNWEIRSATIQDVGDLEVTTGKEVINGENLVCLPGFIVCDPDLDPARTLSDAECMDYLKRGVTTLVGTVDVGNQSAIDRLNELASGEQNPALNIGFVGSLTSVEESVADEDREKFFNSVARNVLAFSSDRISEKFQNDANKTGKKLISGEDLSRKEPPEILRLDEVPHWTGEAAEAFDAARRGTIEQGAQADLILFRRDSNFDENQTLSLENLEIVLIKGLAVYKNGEFLNKSAGEYLMRSDQRATDWRESRPN